jgi:hypothetical protein
VKALLRLRTRGQALVEYSMIAHLILVGGLVGLGIGWPFVAQVLNALTTYFRSIYYVVTSPVP